MAVELPHPALKAILLCERIIEEVGTTRVTLVGILSRLTVREFPADYARGLELYLRVTDAAGQYAIRMEVVRLDGEQIIGWAEATSIIADRMHSPEVGFSLPRVVF